MALWTENLYIYQVVINIVMDPRRPFCSHKYIIYNSLVKCLRTQGRVSLH